MKEVHRERKTSHRRVFSVGSTLQVSEQPEAKAKLRIKRNAFCRIEGAQFALREMACLFFRDLMKGALNINTSRALLSSACANPGNTAGDPTPNSFVGNQAVAMSYPFSFPESHLRCSSKIKEDKC